MEHPIDTNVFLSGLIKKLSQKLNIPAPHFYFFSDKDKKAAAADCISNEVALPTQLFKQHSLEEASFVIAHELAHLRRKKMLWIIEFIYPTVLLVISILLLIGLVPFVQVVYDSSDNLLFNLINTIIDTLAVNLVMIYLLRFWITLLVINPFLRREEYRADAIAAHLVGARGGIAYFTSLPPQPWYQVLLNFIFSTHPSNKRRIRRLKRIEE